MGEKKYRIEFNKVNTQDICEMKSEISRHILLLTELIHKPFYSKHIKWDSLCTFMIFRNQLWVSWYSTKWMVGRKQNNFTCCCHLQVSFDSTHLVWTQKRLETHVARCEEGMTFSGPSYRTICQADGRWSHPVPRCYGESPGFLNIFHYLIASCCSSLYCSLHLTWLHWGQG